MGLPRMGSPRGATSRRVALWSALAVGCILPSVGCQVEYSGMTLPSGKYMHDDVQYFPSGPDFPWANTQAATLDEARANLVEAVELVLEANRALAEERLGTREVIREPLRISA